MPTCVISAGADGRIILSDFARGAVLAKARLPASEQLDEVHAALLPAAAAAAVAEAEATEAGESREAEAEEKAGHDEDRMGPVEGGLYGDVALRSSEEERAAPCFAPVCGLALLEGPSVLAVATLGCERDVAIQGGGGLGADRPPSPHARAVHRESRSCPSLGTLQPPRRIWWTQAASISARWCLASAAALPTRTPRSPW